MAHVRQPNPFRRLFQYIYLQLTGLSDKLADDYAQSARPMDEIFAAGQVDDTEIRALADIKKVEAETLPLTQKVIELRRAGQVEEAVALLLGTVRPLYVEWLRVINVLIDLEEAKSNVESDRARSVAEGFMVLMLGTTLLAILLAVWVAWRITRSIVGPLREASRLSEQVAAGDLTQHIETRSQDETGRLLQALGGMKDNLVGTVTRIRSGAEDMFSASSRIAAGNENLSARTVQQAAALQETAASMEELASTVQLNADHAQQADELAANASDVAQRGGAVVGEVVATMEAISTSSGKIAEIVSVIDSIAFQTNILALNAAVEAARAGDQGKGFAVVAGEVRSLAQRSAQAAREIKDIVDESSGKVDIGTSQVERAGATMQEIVVSVKRVTDIIAEIATASSEQARAIGQVNQAVAQMDQTTQQNAALVSESAEAADALQYQARELVQAVSAFRTPGRGHDGRDQPEGQLLHSPAVRLLG